MSLDPDAAARRIMNQFGEESHIPYLNIEEGDVGVLIAFRSSGSSSPESPASSRLRFRLLPAGSGSASQSSTSRQPT